MYRLILTRPKAGKEYNKDLYAKNILVVLNIHCIVNLGKKCHTETKVPDRTKGGREGKTLLWVNRYPTRSNDWGRTVCGEKCGT